MRFKFFRHTADTKFRAYGASLNEMFENAGLAFFEVMTNTKKVRPLIKKEFTIKSQDNKSLLYDFMEELLFLHETEHLLFSRFKIKIDAKEFTLSCIAYGEEINESHERRALVKAVTYNEMMITKEFVQVVLDL